MKVPSIQAVFVGMALSGVGSASAETCDHLCQIDFVNDAQAVVMYHTRGILSEDMATAMENAVRRKVRVEIFVGRPDETYANVKSFMNGFFRTWNATSADDDTSLLGMGACILGNTQTPPFLVTDPFSWGPNEKPVLVKSGSVTRDLDDVAEFANIVDTEEFIQCKLD